jgi:hypothetical protein
MLPPMPNALARESINSFITLPKRKWTRNFHLIYVKRCQTADSGGDGAGGWGTLGRFLLSESRLFETSSAIFS